MYIFGHLYFLFTDTYVLTFKYTVHHRKIFKPNCTLVFTHINEIQRTLKNTNQGRG